MSRRCFGIRSDGQHCSLDAGYGTDSDLFCRFHEDQTLTPIEVPAGGGETVQAVVISDDDGESPVPEGPVHFQTETGHRIAAEATLLSAALPADDVGDLFGEE